MNEALTAAEIQFLGLYVRLDTWTDRIQAYRDCKCAAYDKQDQSVRKRIEVLVDRPDARGRIEAERARMDVRGQREAEKVDKAKYNGVRAAETLKEAAYGLLEAIYRKGKEAVEGGDLERAAGLGKALDSGAKWVEKLGAGGGVDWDALRKDLQAAGLTSEALEAGGKSVEQVLNEALVDTLRHAPVAGKA